ncbi:MAG: UDP-N-acetylmuramate dehydrogenase [Clostridia bacterium]|nr:UDP-N-acetylmuramate dehydrogenase [Clostridia bacterium]
MEQKLELCARKLSGCKLIKNAPMKEYTSFRIGGPADLLLMPRTREELLLGINSAKEAELPLVIIGNGSNLLVSDKGVDGIVIRIGSVFSGIEYDGHIQKVLSGTLMCLAANDSLDKGFKGLEWATGIPGTVGGAVAMNAGAYGGEVKQVLRQVECLIDGEICSIVPADEDMAYRHSRFCAPDVIVLSAEFGLSPDDGSAKELSRGYCDSRRTKQPLAYPSAGSTFKRPPGHFAGALIEQAGLKGFRVGGAEVSTLHAGFVINIGGATCDDVCSLMKSVQDVVYGKFGIMLEPEVKLIGRGICSL